MTDFVRVYVNARPVDAPAAGTALDAVRAFNPDIAQQVALGTHSVTDSRGIPIDASTALTTGAIFRVVRARTSASESADEE